MKKITLLFICAFAFSFISYAQNDCASAQAVTAGTTTITAIDGTAPTLICDGEPAATAGEWFAFTATIDGVLKVTSDLPANSGGDTNLHIYSGTCGALVCIGGNDDVDLAGQNYLSELTFEITTGSVYYIVFDDRWEATGFDFQVTETAVSCNYSLPYAETFDDNNTFMVCYEKEDVDGDGISWISQQDLDLDGDGTPETFATNGNSAAGATKNDWLISPAFTLDAGTPYEVVSRFNTTGGSGSLEAFIIDGPTYTANQVATLFSNANIPDVTAFADLETQAYEEMHQFTPTSTGDYHIAYRSFGAGGTGFLLLFDSNITSTLSVDEFASDGFSYFYDKNTDVLKLESTIHSGFTAIQIHNILGQEIVNRPLSNKTEYIDLSSFQEGVLLTKVFIDGKVKVLKIIKH
ncbi:T9SS type A sorting domain-containing protein [Bizionia gelidisalsuginis]|uniref:T9SS type A sorting domain-containing protein n=2 Tax=Bizionia TaxID=283785 RepID=A0A8H2LIT4_9FLAO|nr:MULTISPECIES: T9SS type A sorting domain-containing protein [Bizionia]TYB77990.1 T9SS type A sorting domain-containing protein [Bizionia saleffrena]TYC12706.1 T9SS type A sorting domain-containing protein [Bizionia gelidisalsuginis]